MSNRRYRERWAARRAAGLCGECGVVPSVRFSRCQLCRQIVSEERQRWWRGGANAVINAKRRQQYADFGHRIS